MSKTIGKNPLEEYFSTNKLIKKENNQEKINPAKVIKQRITIHIPVDLIDRVKNVVYWEPGLTLADFSEKAFEMALTKMEKDRGENYPERKEKLLKSGRPIR